jgi:hypothetical protein
VLTHPPIIYELDDLYMDPMRGILRIALPVSRLVMHVWRWRLPAMRQ